MAGNRESKQQSQHREFHMKNPGHKLVPRIDPRIDDVTEDSGISRIIVAGNDVEFSGALKQHLERDHFAITLVHDGEAAVEQALTGNHDVVVLEAAIPGMD